MMNRMVVWVAMVGCAALLSACGMTDTMVPGKQAKQAMMAEQSLYDRLGGKPAIEAVVDDFLARVAADERINGRFANANIPRLKMKLVEQICQASGGPCTYTGRDMKTTHAGMQISDAEFDALVGDLAAALKKFKVGKREQTELLSALAPLKKDIVERSSSRVGMVR